MTDVLCALGGNHPDAVLFSTHVMEKFEESGGDPRDDFGGYLMMFSDFLDQYLETGRLLEAETPLGRIDWTLPWVKSILFDPTLSGDQVAERLGCKATVVRQRRLDAGFSRKYNEKNKPWEGVPEWEAILRDPTVSLRKAGKVFGISHERVREARIALGMDTGRRSSGKV